MKKSIIMAIVVCSALLACKKESPYYIYTNEVAAFKGNAYEYLKSQKDTYDSLIFVAGLLPDVKQALEEQQVTFFAPTNASFQAAVSDLNGVRKSQGKAPLYLRNLIESDPEGLETLLCRYILPERHQSDYYKPYLNGVYINSFKTAYQMHVSYVRKNASGYTDGGPVSLVFSDTRGSRIELDWFKTETNAVNIITDNATINPLQANHGFGFDDFVARFNK